MDTTQLEYFREIAKEGSVSRAASKFHLSQPAMSARMRRLEEELGVTLFERHPNRIELNENGRIALAHAEVILERLCLMREDLLAAAGREQSLRAVFCDPGVMWFCEARFCADHPEFTFHAEQLKEKDGLVLLKEREADLVISGEKIMDPGVVSVPFLFDQVYLCAPERSPLSRREQISLREIRDETILIPDFGGNFIERVKKVVREEALPVRFSENTFNVFQYLIRKTDDLALISRLALDLRNDGPGRRLVPMTDVELSLTYYLSYLKVSREKVRPFTDWTETNRNQDRFVEKAVSDYEK